jgi:hypothetical protein
MGMQIVQRGNGEGEYHRTASKKYIAGHFRLRMRLAIL